ncbi:MAG: arylsulfatase A [Mariniblastus sp.]|jgi:arylsulfatase A
MVQTFIKHVVVFVFTVLGSTALIASPLPQPESPPRAENPLNVILIMADDSAADNYGCYGSTFFKTPTLDALAKAGAKFNHCYSEPVCTSSRVKIMTGRDGIRNYVAFGSLDKSETTFGTMMKKHGYATAVAGKWQLQGGPNGSLAPDCGFDNYCLWNYPGTERARYWNPSIMRDGKLVETTEKDYGPDIFTNYLIDFIEQSKERPFFIYYPMVLVHSPFPVTPDSEPPTKGDELKKDAVTLKNFRDMTLYADKCVQRIVEALDRNGLRENTVLIYTTDNGTGRGLTYPYRDEQRNGEKAYATDGGTHAPLIVNCPGVVPAGIVTDDLVDFSDVMPTLAEITTARLPNVELDGRSFWQQCLGSKGNPRKWIFQYYYPKFGPAAEKHGQGVNKREIVWAQNQHFKLYRDGAMFAVKDRHETTPIILGKSREADNARTLLQRALDSMPSKAAKLKATTQSQ